METVFGPIGDQALFFQVWEQCRKEVCLKACGGNCAACRPSPWVVSRLLGLLAKEGDKGVDELSPVIGSIVQESRFIGDSGELLAHPPQLPPVENQVNLIIQTLKRMQGVNVQ